MNYISDVDYMSELMDRIQLRSDMSSDINKIVKDFTPLASGTDNFLDGSIVEFVTNGSQLYYESSGGKFGFGHLAMSAKGDISDDKNRTFLLQWNSDPKGSGYFLWPYGEANVNNLIFMDLNDLDFNVINNNLPGGNDTIQRQFIFPSVKVNSNKVLVCELEVTTRKGNYNVYVDPNLKVTAIKGGNPTDFTMKFLSLGQKAWETLIDKDNNIASRCCFDDVVNYLHFQDACNAKNFTTGSPKCQSVIPDACKNTYGYDDSECKKWCQKYPADCFNSINDWCNTKNNLTTHKDLCVCFDKGAFKKFSDDYKKACKNNCKVSNFTTGCFYPPCLQSGMNNVANQGTQCPSNTTIFQKCIQSLKATNFAADKVIQQCNLLAGQVDPPDNSGGGGGNIAQPPPDNSTTAPLPPPIDDSSSNTPNFWQKYMWYIIGGVSVIVLLVIIAVVMMSMSK